VRERLSVSRLLRGILGTILLFTTACASTNWEFLNRMSTARSGHTATLLKDGHVLIAGGFNSDGVLASSEIFDPSTKTWSPTGSMQTPRTRHTATLLPDGTVLVTGGATNTAHPTSVTETVEKYDPATGVWTRVKAMSTKRAFHTATLLTDGSVLVVAGGPTGSLAGQLSAERYFPGNNSWTSSGATRVPHTRGTATLMPNGNALVAGGVQYGPEQDNPQEILINYSERYDKDTNKWFELAVMQETPFAHTATLLLDQTVLVAGGRAVATLSNAVRYVPNLETGGDYPPVWNSTSNLAHARSNHQATRLQNGDVLVTGGFLDCVDRTNPPGGCSASLITCEVYHPDPNSLVAGTWSAQEDMFNYRGDHTSTLLNNGTVLVTGGYNWSAQSVLDSAELVWPQGKPAK
jgi:hypothetical protein